MTDNEIIKALRRCTTMHGLEACEDCPLKGRCAEDDELLTKYAFSLICRQKAEIEALQMDNEQLHSDIINANQNLEHMQDLLNFEKKRVKTAKQKVITACKMLKNAKNEAVDEFAERLYPLHKALCIDEGDWCYEIGRIAEEMRDQK